MMIKYSRFFSVLVVLVTTLVAAPVFARDKSTFKTDLSGYDETPATVNSPGNGTFVAKISKDESSISYKLTYTDLPTNVQQAHIHFGRPGLSGGVALFLCTNLTPPPVVPVPPLCLTSPGTVSGMLTAADVIALPNQGIDAATAGFAEMIKALRNGAAYVNVHTTQRPSGEIRGPLGQPDDDDD